MDGPERFPSSDQGSTAALNAGLAVAGVTALAVGGPLVGISPGWITVAVVAGLVLLSVDAARFSGLGGHLLAEALPLGIGAARLRRIAIHEAGHVLVAADNNLPVTRVLVGSRACLGQGLRANGSTELEPPPHAKLPLEDLRRWSRVLQAGMVAETLIYGGSRGGADDRALLGRLWGLSGHPVATAQQEQRRARREVEQWLRQHRSSLEAEAEGLLRSSP
ncbi:hypothetical protein [Vulcanococcus sp.]|jgi:hypothetical protein|uniref:hypothetical protein n=1 Tax=Vulcanococcus sp. TaxID=2856995 RepID=UPI003509BA81